MKCSPEDISRIVCLLAVVVHAAGTSPASGQQLDRTFHELAAENAVVVFAERGPALDAVGDHAPSGGLRFTITEVVKGKALARADDYITTWCRDDEADSFLVYATEQDVEDDSEDKKAVPLKWSNAMHITDSCMAYIRSLPHTEQTVQTRLLRTLGDLQHDDRQIAENAHLEFALASDEDLLGIKDKLKRTELIEWLKSPEITAERKRLYFFLLSLCDEASDGEWIASEMFDKDARSLNAAIACYLHLTGDAGLKQINDRYLASADTTYPEAFAVLQAVRHVGYRSDSRFSGKQIVNSLRMVLDNPKMADLVIYDLVAFEDWESTNRITSLLRDEKAKWCQVPAIIFLRACPLPEAREVLEEARLDHPNSIRRADIYGPAIDLSKQGRRYDVRRRGRPNRNACWLSR